MAWTGFLKSALATLGLSLLALLALVVAMNPFGNLPALAFRRHVIMDTSDRYHFPALVRSGDFDSVVIGTSTSKLLDPAHLESAFGGKFANLAMNDGRAWEQYQLASLFLRTVPRPATLLIGLDVVWCDPEADMRRTTDRGFPPWIYDDSPWNDWLYVLNVKTADVAARQLLHRVGLMPARFPHNGYDLFVPPEARYDAVKAQRIVWRRNPVTSPAEPPYAATAEEREGWRYPALDWLADILERAPAEARIVLAFMPVHVAAQPQPGSLAAAREAECKARIATMAARKGAHAIDFRVRSAITGADTNYWDAVHFRVPIAHRVVDALAKATTSRASDPAGDWVYLAGPARP